MSQLPSGPATPGPATPPIGLHLARTARVVGQAFDRAMGEAGGSGPLWQVLLLVRSQNWDTQSAMAEQMGITGPTLTHHLTTLETRGLIRRWRDDANRRVQRVELTEAGIDLFDRLREVARRHDERLRAQLTDDELGLLAGLLDRLERGITAADSSDTTSPA
jgi:MarR family transcriptional regulator for hemolysin